MQTHTRIRLTNRAPLSAVAALLIALTFPALTSTAPAQATATVVWDANPESDIAGYQLSYGTSPGVHPNVIDAGLETTTAVTGLQAGTTYYFVVTASNQAGLESQPSAEISYQVPTAPAGPVAVIPRTGWSLRYVDSQESVNYPASYAFDGNPNTFWCTNYLSPTLPPHELQLDLGAIYPVGGFRYLPRQDSYSVGHIGQYEFYVSMDGTQWGTPAASGEFSYSNTEKQVLCSAKSGRYVKLRILTEVGGDKNCTVAELNILQTSGTAPVNQAPVAVSSAVTTAANTPVAIGLGASDADGNSLSYSIVSAPTHGTLSGTAPNLTYSPVPNYTGSDSITFKANDGTADSNTATVSVTVTAPAPLAVIPRTGWSLRYVDSQESVNYPASYAFDGNPNTFWCTNYLNPTLPPHELQLDLGAVYPVGGFRYLPRQDSYTVGHIGQYEFYVSMDGTQWGTPVASGAFSYSNTEKQVLCSAKSGRYVKLRVLTEVGGDKNCTVAELNILQGSAVTVPVNQAPVFATDPILAADAKESVAYTGQTLAGMATDADAGDTITYSKVSGPAWLAVAANGALSGTPAAGSAGLQTFVVRVTDSASATDDAELRIQVAGLPLPWVTADLGTGQLAGSATYTAGTFSQAGSGKFGGSSDTLRFTYQTLSGDGEIIAKVSALQNTGTASRVGVMIRDTLATNSKQSFMGMTGSNAYRWVRRTSTGGSNSTTSSSTGTVPNTWVRLVRSGNTITAYKGANGTTWTTVGSTTVTLATNCYIGLAVTSGTTTTLNTSQFSNVSVTP